MKSVKHALHQTVAPVAEVDMNRKTPLLYRLLAVAALWPTLALGQASTPATEAAAASAPAPAGQEAPAAQPAAASEAAPAAAAEAKPAAAAAAKPAAAETIEYSKKGADTCLTCHDDAHVMAIFKTRHGNPNDARSPFGKGQLQCEACHGPGGKHTGKIKKGETRPPMIRFGRDSAAPVSVQNGVCLTCHEKSLSANWHAGPHAANNVTVCACHDLHVGEGPGACTRAPSPRSASPAT